MIPVSQPDLSGNEEAYVRDAVRSSWISSTGPYVERFEAEFAALAGTRHAITVSNGTVALHLAMLSLGIDRGDEVIVPSLTYVATANAVRYVGATPVFADVSAETWCLDPASVESAITERTRAVIAVDLYGHPADMDAIRAVTEGRGIAIVEDAAEAHCARYRGRPAGSLGDIATFSFYGNKIMTSGEGGAVTLDDDDLAARARILRGQGQDPERRYHFPVVGHNFRLTNVACALLCAQLEHIDEILAERRRVAGRYAAGLNDVAGIGLQPIAEWAIASPWLVSITVDAAVYGCSRDALMAHLRGAGVDTRPFFYPLHGEPSHADAYDPSRPLPVTERLGASGLNLPTFTTLADGDIDRICDTIRDGGR